MTPGWFWTTLLAVTIAAAALTLDEFALWLHLADVWSPQERLSVEVALLFGSLLAVLRGGGRFFHAMAPSRCCCSGATASDQRRLDGIGIAVPRLPVFRSGGSDDSSARVRRAVRRGDHRRRRARDREPEQNRQNDQGG